MSTEKELKDRISELEAEVRGLRKDIKTVRGALSQQQQRAKEMTDIAEQKQIKVTALESDKEEIRNKRETIRGQLEKAEADREKLTEDLREAQALIEAVSQHPHCNLDESICETCKAIARHREKYG